MEVLMRIVFLFIVMISSSTEEVKNLTGIEGANITLPDRVGERGFLIFEGKAIAGVNSGVVEIHEESYTNRVHWDKNTGHTGFFIITGLQRSDSGTYNIDSKKVPIFLTRYKLTVYESVPTPAVNTSDCNSCSVSTESCILLCSVEKAEETTLLWYKGEEILNQSSSALSLPLTVHKQDFSSSYRCVAANPAENKTFTVNIKTSCRQPNNTGRRHYIVTGIIIFSIVSVLALGIITMKKCLNKTKTSARQTEDSVNTYTEATYTDIQISDNRRCQAGNLPDSSGTVDHSNLTTVYDKLEAHRML